MMNSRTTRATPIMLVRATCRVPFGLMPVTAAIAVTRAARISQVYQLMPEGLTRSAPSCLAAQTDDRVHQRPRLDRLRQVQGEPAAQRLGAIFGTGKGREGS